MKRCLLTHSLTNTLIKNKNEVGEHPLFSEGNVLEVCRLNQIGLLTSVCAAYDFIAKQTSPSRAKTEIIKLLKRGSEVTGPEITALRNRFEDAKPKPEPKVEAGTETTLMEIISSGTTFDNLLLTPPDKLLRATGSICAYVMLRFLVRTYCMQPTMSRPMTGRFGSQRRQTCTYA